MMRSMWSATAGLKNHQTWMDSVGNNIANVNTTAYKANEVSFKDVLYQNMSPSVPAGAAGAAVNAKQVGLGVSLSSTLTNITTQGSMLRTDAPLDMMITGTSFFVVHGNGKEYYTKDGSFVLDENSDLTMSQNGYYVYGWTSKDGKTIDRNDPIGKINFFGIGNTGDGAAKAVEPTANITFTGNIDDNDADMTSSLGETRSVQVTDSEGNQYTLKFSLHSNGDGSFEMQTISMTGKNGTVDVSGIPSVNLAYDYATGAFLNANGNTNGKVSMNIPNIGAVSLDFSKTTGTSSLGDNVVISQTLPDWVKLENTDKEGDQTYLSDKNRITLKDENNKDQTYTASRLRFGDGFNKADLIGNGFHTTCCTCQAHYSIRFNEGGGNSMEESGQHMIYNIDIKDADSAEAVVDAIIKGVNEIENKEGTTANPSEHYTNFRKDPNDPTSLIVYDNRPGMSSGDGFGIIGRGVATQKESNPGLSTLEVEADGGAVNGFTVADDGKIYLSYANGNNPKLIGQIAVATFDNPQGLGKVGQNLFEETPNSGELRIHDVTEDGGSIKTGVLESSNVQLADEFSDMILAQRGFQTNSRVIRVSDEMLQTVSELKR